MIEERIFIGAAGWVLMAPEDLLLWWEDGHIRIDLIGGGAFDATTGKPVDVAIYLDPSSPAWSQAAQLADDE